MPQQSQKDEQDKNSKYGRIDKKIAEHNKAIHTHKLTLGQRAADRIARWGGSWYFISGFSVFLVIWMAINFYTLLVWDEYPFILLNLVLSCLAAIQAPIILMSQNRAAERDRMKSERDFAVNRKAEREIEDMQEDLEQIKRMLNKVLGK